MSKIPKTINTLDHGYVTLYDWMGSDLRIVNMARQSFGKHSTILGEPEKGLINYLMANRHGTPFEGVVFTFNVKCPLFTAREWFRHRISSYNEYSGRYSKMINEFYVPDPKQIRSQKGKPGAYKFEPVKEDLSWSTQQIIKGAQSTSWRLYEHLLDLGIAKEVARIVLPVSIYTQFTWVVNLRALFNFISLRSADNAMWEIRQYSQNIEKLIEPIVPIAYEAFNKNGKVAP